MQAGMAYTAMASRNPSWDPDPMDIWKLRRAGHLPTLFCSFLYFTISCMAWMMVGALANSIIPDLGGLSDSRKGLMVAVPVLGGALLRLVFGPLADHAARRRQHCSGWR